MTYSITKDFHFSASHVLLGLPEGHQCGRLHGHNYVLRVCLQGNELLPQGFLFDYGDLAPVADMVAEVLDHRHLNDWMDANPTAEALAYAVGNTLPAILPLPADVTVAVGVSETPKTWAWWTP